MAEGKKKTGGNLALIFGGGGGDDAAAPGGADYAPGDGDGDELGGFAGEEEEESDAPPADFALHASEAFPELAGDDARIEALYRTIQACHPKA